MTWSEPLRFWKTEAIACARSHRTEPRIALSPFVGSRFLRKPKSFRSIARKAAISRLRATSSLSRRHCPIRPGKRRCRAAILYFSVHALPHWRLRRPRSARMPPPSIVLRSIGGSRSKLETFCAGIFDGASAANRIVARHSMGSERAPVGSLCSAALGSRKRERPLALRLTTNEGRLWRRRSAHHRRSWPAIMPFVQPGHIGNTPYLRHG